MDLLRLVQLISVSFAAVIGGYLKILSPISVYPSWETPDLSSPVSPLFDSQQSNNSVRGMHQHLT